MGGGRKPLIAFQKKRSNKDEYNNCCRLCDQACSKAWRVANPERHRANATAWSKANPEKKHVTLEAWVKAHPEAIALYAKKKREAYQIETYGRILEPYNMTRDCFRAARQLGFRSGLEVALAKQLDDNQVTYVYEGTTFRYIQPEEERRMTPDFILPNFIIVEGKGVWDSADRKKWKLFRQQYPDIDVRFVFSRSASRISKTSKTTYADICRTLGIPFADKWIPIEWTREPLNEKSQAACEAAMDVH